MQSKKSFLQHIFLVILLGTHSVASAKQWLVKTPDEYNKAVKKVVAGDRIVLANGVWQDFEILFKGQGTEQKPIELTAQTKGKVIIVGQSNLRLAGEYLLVSGLVFKDGFSPTGEVISFRQNSTTLANHSRVSETVIDHFNNPDKFSSDNWVLMYGRYNRFDHNHLEGKSNAGVTMAVRLNSEASQQNHHQIDHNYFGPRPILGSNGGETLRIGTSHFSLSDSFTVVENNFFDRCNGEVEIISNKSGSNTFRNNVFFESRGTLTLRHGSGNLVENNVFLGNGVDHTGGIRVINGNQTIRNNYLSGLTGTRFGAGFVVMNGVPNSTINRYHQVENALIENNTLIDVTNIGLAAGSDDERTAVPLNSQFKRNVIINQDKQDPFHILDKVSGITFADNVISQTTASEINSGFSVSSSELEQADNGLWYPKDPKLAELGASRSLQPITKEQVGVSWYPKIAQTVNFTAGKITTVSSAEQLVTGLKNAQRGEQFVLSDGKYILDKILNIHTVVSIQAANSGQVTLLGLRSVMFELADGGSLKLQGIVIDGSEGIDAAGNVLIRNTKLPTLQNYTLELNEVKVVNLDVNHSFHVFDAGYRSMADLISITNSQFENITGDILRLNKEQDDLGIYNAEYVVITNNKFTKVEGAIANIYRGGTDESTFGPHLDLSHNIITNVGKGKRNKSGASLFLHGTQVNSIDANQFVDSAPVVLEHTVGEPRTSITNNQFSQTAQPVIKQLFPLSSAVITMSGNTNQ
ncbi:polysaccharide lyase 6 family protein [Paraglaciecola sp.]|uniref:polysaccharide lyase 6 family protein n=1 Tax=Paraglaciecola sp. TaxID=1920173 RepID=UPI0030F3E97E